MEAKMKFAILLVQLLILSVLLPSSLSPLYAQKKAEPVNKASGDLAIKGYDPVAYFKEGRAIPGSASYEYLWMGAKWRFASAANRDLFAKSPDKYAPQFGGYCSWAVSNNYVYDADPSVWKIVDGKLYLNYNRSAQQKWESDLRGRILKGEQNWPALHR